MSPFTEAAAQQEPESAAHYDRTKQNSRTPRKQRLLLSVTGMVALAGLGALAALFTAPFADPPAAAGDIRAAALPAAVAAEKDSPDAAAAQLRVPAAKLQPDPPPAPRPAIAPVLAELEAEALATDDPRWAKTAALSESAKAGLNAKAVLASAPAGPAEAPAAQKGDGAVSMAAPVAPPQDEPVTSSAPAPMDDTRTAAIPPQAPIVEAASPKPDKAPTVGAVPSGAAPSSTVKVTSAVKMRARGADGARVVAVIPDNAAVGLVGCKIWCEVVYNGSRGFIFKGFVKKSGNAADQAQPQAAKEPDGPKIVKATRIFDPNGIGR